MVTLATADVDPAPLLDEAIRRFGTVRAWAMRSGVPERTLYRFLATGRARRLTVVKLEDSLARRPAVSRG